MTGSRTLKKVETDTTLLVEGYAEIKVIKGNAEVFGSLLRNVNVPEGRVLPVYFLSDSEIELSGKCMEVEGSTIPESWTELVEEDWRRIFIFGEPDSGKSSLATYLVNKKQNIKWVVDLDVGQASIAHPAAMGIGIAEEGILSLSDIKMFDGFFTGYISPANNVSRCIRGVKRLSNIIGSDEAIIDSTGWIRGRRARDYKLAKLEIIEPDVIACFGEIPYYLEDYEVYRVDSFVLKKRSRELRGVIRERIYSKWLEDAEMMEFDCNIVYNTSLFKGEEIHDSLLSELIEEEIIFTEKGYDFLNIIVRTKFEAGFELLRAIKEIYGVEEVNILAENDFKNLMVGIYSEKYLGIGLIENVDFENKKIKIITPARKDVKRIEFGELRLESGKDVFAKIP
jgi:polynucleotide 5'-hydroxyl-kinase GRC3/NOL9